MRLIDADALPKYTGYALSADEVAKAVENAPTIEAEPNSCKYWDSESHFCALRRPQAEPVRRGRWNDMRENSKDVPHIECSACGKPIYTTIRYAYCPNCGAKMDVEKI